jgi:lipopolysaccharide/colanic/teichoic acid biosynthesis glycosyltransferase
MSLDGSSFAVYKFRSMYHEAEAVTGPIWADDEDPRCTPFGRYLRHFDIDELPQLWNVLRGDMSLVGPRPLLPEYLDRYSREQARRHEVTPGITGLAQVKGRNALSWERKFALDVWYVDHRSLVLDLKLLLLTAGTVLRRRGVSAPGHATMPEFCGSAREETMR